MLRNNLGIDDDIGELDSEDEKLFSQFMESSDEDLEKIKHKNSVASAISYKNFNLERQVIARHTPANYPTSCNQHSFFQRPDKVIIKSVPNTDERDESLDEQVTQSSPKRRCC
jgi:hypothetical protein